MLGVQLVALLWKVLELLSSVPLRWALRFYELAPLLSAPCFLTAKTVRAAASCPCCHTLPAVVDCIPFKWNPKQASLPLSCLLVGLLSWQQEE